MALRIKKAAAKTRQPHTFLLANTYEVTIRKRAGNRNIRLSVKADGSINVTIPTWAGYYAGRDFAESKLDWIRSQIPERTVLKDGQIIGKFHHLALAPTHGLSKPRSLVTTTTLTVRYPFDWSADDQRIQDIAAAACIRALRLQAEQLLPPRLADLAQKHGFSYNGVQIKRLKGRWGSCDQHQHIVLNLFLMQLPWECIDYVLLHELTHTRIMQHGEPFWSKMQGVVPDLARIRKIMRTHQPVLR